MEWIKVSDELPEESTEVLILINGKYTGVAYYESVGLICQFQNDHYDNFFHADVTHWMSFDKLPKP
jgi:hypothetical protein